MHPLNAVAPIVVTFPQLTVVNPEQPLNDDVPIVTPPSVGNVIVCNLL